MEQEQITWCEVKWTAEDIKSLRPHWTEDQCNEWLAAVEDRMRDRMIEVGWEIIESFIDSEED